MALLLKEKKKIQIKKKEIQKSGYNSSAFLHYLKYDDVWFLKRKTVRVNSQKKVFW